jgi:flagellar protein FlaG
MFVQNTAPLSSSRSVVVPETSVHLLPNVPLTTTKENAASASAPDASEEQPQQPDLMESAAQLEEKLAGFGVKVRFSVHNATHQVIVQVYDAETQEVIREIPPEQIVKALSKIQNLSDAKGMLLDEQV